MSNANPEEVSVVVSEHGVSVEKSFEPDDFPVPAIAFVIQSSRDEPVDIRIVDDVPEDVNATDIGFHPKYGAEYWSVDGEQIVFERSFEAGEEYTTVYGLRTEDPSDIERYLSEPSIERVDPPLEDAGAVIRDVIGDDTEPAIEAVDSPTDAGEPDDDPIEPLELRDPNDAAAEGATDSTSLESDGSDIEAVAEAEPNPPTSTAEVPTDVPAADLASALAAQLRAGEVGDDDLETLRDALGVETEGPVESAGSLNAKITRLQTEIADLEAYTDALEAFLDENGDAQTLLRDLRSSLDSVRSKVQTLDGRSATTAEDVADLNDAVGRLDDTVSDVQETVGSLEGDVADVEDDVTAATDEVATVRETVGSLEGDVADVEDDVTAATNEVADVREEVDGVRIHVDEVDEDIADLRGELRDLETELDELELEEVEELSERVGELDDRLAETTDQLEETSERLDDLEAVEDRLDETSQRLDDMDDRLDDLAAMRERLSSVFAAAADPDDEGDYE